MESINFSIIIPHKNNVNLLRFCLDSIPLREDVQVIVVDDNSDSSLVDFNVFPMWPGKHFECHFTKENGGAGYARNIGLKHVKGEWILFADADDFFSEKANAIFDCVLHINADVVFTRPRGVMLHDRNSHSTRADHFNQIIDDYLYSNNEKNIRTSFWVPWCKFIRISLIRQHKVWFDEIPYSNDLFFSMKIGCAANSIAVINDYFYFVTESEHSLTSNFGNKEGENLSRTIGLFHSNIVAAKYKYDDLYCFIHQLRELYTNNPPLFIIGVACITKEGYNLPYVIQHVFASETPFFRVKHSLKAFIIILAHLFSLKSFSYKHRNINKILIQNAFSNSIIRL